MGKVTLEKLAVMVQKGFEETAKRKEVDKRFDEVGEEFGLVRGRLDAVESELIEMRNKLDNIIYRHEFEALKDRIAALEKRLKLAR